ncbi:hypothetical protein CDL15_Pgr011879 [Punica granatum]|uniref:Uncharacterized protein n=1 Tax=Punica granatum TaxID=22663 RepID=A0A218XE19_PUNGR|nr:hypothetical protein CDL15_Pgr011879 [Punica granatum]
MADDCHPELNPVSCQELNRFIAKVDGKIRFLLKGLRAQYHMMKWVFEALRSYQESMKRRLEGVVNMAFEIKNEDDALKWFTESRESIALVEALNHFFWKKEEEIDARLNKCCELIGAAWWEEPKEESRPADGLDQPKDPAKSEEDQVSAMKPNGPNKSEECQEQDKKPKGPAKRKESEEPNIMPKDSVEGEEGQKPDIIDFKGFSEDNKMGKDAMKEFQGHQWVAEENLEHDAVRTGTSVNFSELIRGIQRVDDKIESLLMIRSNPVVPILADWRKR